MDGGIEILAMLLKKKICHLSFIQSRSSSITGKLLGPTAWVLKGATIDSSKVYLKYQGFT
jgi:hypothetical protein